MAQNFEDEGHAVQIVAETENGEFELNDEALSKILLQESIFDTPTVVVSIAGDFRKGEFLTFSYTNIEKVTDIFQR